MNQQEASILLLRYIRARYPLISILSHEETRVQRQIEEVAANLKCSFIATWTNTQGLTLRHLEGADWQPVIWDEEARKSTLPDNVESKIKQDAESTRDPAAMCKRLLDYPLGKSNEEQLANRTLFILKDLHGFLGTKDRGFQPVVTRYLRDISARLECSRHTVILLDPTFQIPPDLEKTIVMIDWPLPTADELAVMLETRERQLPDEIKVTLNGHRDAVVQALRGLTQFEAESVLLAGIVATRELGDSVIPYIIQEKAQIIRKSGVLEYFDNQVTNQDVGGLSNLKRYTSRKFNAFSAKARQAGMDTPKGFLLVGVPGTGKSLSAKATAGAFRMPLLRMDVGALMGGLVGQSEANTRQALKTAEAVAPCVLWLDEIEKALGGTGGEHDGGTSKRVFGTILTWMQEKTAPVYIIATANDVTALAPELISRFDDVLFVDLPNQADREAILTVHLSKRNQTPAHFDLPAVAKALWGYSGREIEKVVRSAIEDAFDNGQPLTSAHLLEAATEIVPVTVTMKPQIDRIRQWVETSQARQAGDPLEPAPVSVGNRSHKPLDI